MQVLMFLLLIVGNMRNMQYNMQQYAKYANTISICRICTPHFADDMPGINPEGMSWPNGQGIGLAIV